MNKPLMFLLVAAFFISFFLPAMADNTGGTIYEDPRGRYSVTLPENWTALEDGRKDVFTVTKEEETGFLAIMSFPPKEEEFTVDNYLDTWIEYLQPFKVLDKGETEFAGEDGAFIDFVEKIEWVGITGKALDELKDKFPSDKLTKLEELKDEKFTAFNLTIKLLEAGLGEEEIRTVFASVQNNNVEDSVTYKRKTAFLLMKDDEVVVFTLEGPEEEYSLFEEDFEILRDSFKLQNTFGGCLYGEPEGFYSLQLPWNWGIGPDTREGINFLGLYDDGKAICDVAKEAKPMTSSSIELIMDYWKDSIKESGHKIKDVETIDFPVSGEETGLIRHDYIDDTGKAHIVEDYILVKGSYLVIITFNVEEDFYEFFAKDFEFILKNIQVDL